MATVNAAYDLLGDPDARAAYDRTRRRETAPDDKQLRPEGGARWAWAAVLVGNVAIAETLRRLGRWPG